MQKSKLGISVGLLGALACVSALCGGYVATFLIVGYILMFESNEWLKKIAVKALVIMCAFSVLGYLIGLIPDAVGTVNSLLNIFGQTFSYTIVNNIVYFCTDILNILEKVVLLVLGLKALSQGDVGVGPIDGIIAKHFASKEENAKGEAKEVAKLSK